MSGNLLLDARCVIRATTPHPTASPSLSPSPTPSTHVPKHRACNGRARIYVINRFASTDRRLRLKGDSVVLAARQDRRPTECGLAMHIQRMVHWEVKKNEYLSLPSCHSSVAESPNRGCFKMFPAHWSDDLA